MKKHLLLVALFSLVFPLFAQAQYRDIGKLSTIQTPLSPNCTYRLRVSLDAKNPNAIGFIALDVNSVILNSSDYQLELVSNELSANEFKYLGGTSLLAPSESPTRDITSGALKIIYNLNIPVDGRKIRPLSLAYLSLTGLISPQLIQTATLDSNKLVLQYSCGNLSPSVSLRNLKK